MNKTAKYSVKTLAVSLVVVCALVLLAVGVHKPAQADELSEARTALESASNQLNSITQEYNQLQSSINTLDAQMTETSEKVMQAQQAMLDGQTILGEAAKDSYKAEGNSSLVGVFLMSEDLEAFLKNITYYSAIQEDQAQLIKEQKKLRDKFQETLGQLESQKNELDGLQAQSAAKKAQAEQVVAEAASKVSSIESERSRLEELQKKASSLKNTQEETKNSNTPVKNWNTKKDKTDTGSAANSGGSDSGGSSSGSSGKSDNSQNNSGNSSGATGGNTGGSTAPSASWNTGVASAYGGSSDPTTPNPGRTATGAICNDTSMGVAVPMSWPGYRKYFGHLVEIKYNGRTVIATINDCGYMGAGSRSLDLQPGVFKAFGFKTCQAWGIRTVQYRIL